MGFGDFIKKEAEHAVAADLGMEPGCCARCRREHTLIGSGCACKDAPPMNGMTCDCGCDCEPTCSCKNGGGW